MCVFTRPHLAWRVTNETYRWLSDARFHPSGSKIIATKWYTSSRSLGAGEGWVYDVPAATDETTIGIGSGKRLIGRTLPFGWSAEDYEDQQIGPEQLVWWGDDAVIYSKNVADSEGSFEYSKGRLNDLLISTLELTDFMLQMYTTGYILYFRTI